MRSVLTMRYSEREKPRPQPVPMNDIRGLWQQVRKETGLLDVRYETPVHRQFKADIFILRRVCSVGAHIRRS